MTVQARQFDITLCMESAWRVRDALRRGLRRLPWSPGWGDLQAAYLHSDNPKVVRRAEEVLRLIGKMP